MVFCPLCLAKGHFLEAVQGPDKREYRRCTNCKLIYTATKQQLSKTQEKKHVELHKNGIDNVNYVKYLNKAIEPALVYLNKDMKGLDYGSGPEPTLYKILTQMEFNCDKYDPIYAPKELTETFDYVFATECFEHFFLPAKELKQLKNIIKEDGYLIVMTDQYVDVPQFKTWAFAKDPTNVSFYHKQSFEFICKKYGFKIVFNDNDTIIILQRETAEKEELNVETSVI